MYNTANQNDSYKSEIISFLHCIISSIRRNKKKYYREKEKKKEYGKNYTKNDVREGSAVYYGEKI